LSNQSINQKEELNVPKLKTATKSTITTEQKPNKVKSLDN